MSARLAALRLCVKSGGTGERVWMGMICEYGTRDAWDRVGALRLGNFGETMLGADTFLPSLHVQSSLNPRPIPHKSRMTAM